jgi:hypothetical protein
VVRFSGRLGIAVVAQPPQRGEATGQLQGCFESKALRGLAQPTYSDYDQRFVAVFWQSAYRRYR